MEFTRLGIVGSGIMAAGIAEVAATHGYEVVVRGRSQSSADAVQATVAASLERQVSKERCSSQDRDAAMSRLRVTTDVAAFSEMDLVIESVLEDLTVKKHLFVELDQACAERTVLATNTSTLPVVELAMVTDRPAQVCGIHFFNPAAAMPLVEIVRPITAATATVAAACAFAERCGKEPVMVKDQAGFVVNALLFPYLNSAVRLFEQGVATKEGIDTAMRGGCGFPMGPFALLDLVGLDTSVAILDALYDEHREPQYAAAPLLRRMVSAEQLGRKSGRGFYRYDG